LLSGNFISASFPLIQCSQTVSSEHVVTLIPLPILFLLDVLLLSDLYDLNVDVIDGYILMHLQL